MSPTTAWFNNVASPSSGGVASMLPAMPSVLKDTADAPTTSGAQILPDGGQGEESYFSLLSPLMYEGGVYPAPAPDAVPDATGSKIAGVELGVADPDRAGSKIAGVELGAAEVAGVAQAGSFDLADADAGPDPDATAPQIAGVELGAAEVAGVAQGGGFDLTDADAGPDPHATAPKNAGMELGAADPDATAPQIAGVELGAVEVAGVAQGGGFDLADADPAPGNVDVSSAANLLEKNAHGGDSSAPGAESTVLIDLVSSPVVSWGSSYSPSLGSDNNEAGAAPTSGGGAASGAAASAKPVSPLIKYGRFSSPEDLIYSIGKVFVLRGQRLQVQS